MLSVGISGFSGVKINAYSKILISICNSELFGSSLFRYYFLKHVSNTDFPHIICLQYDILMFVVCIVYFYSLYIKMF